MKLKSYCCFIVFLPLLISGCSSLEIPEETTSISSVAPSVTYLEALEATSEKPTITSQTPTKMQDSTIATETPATRKSIVRIERVIPEEIEWTGSLLEYDRDQGQYSLLKFPRSIEYPLPGNKPWFGGYSLFAVSPDRSMLAYIFTTIEGEKKLSIVTGNPPEQVVHDWPNEKGWDIIRWLDNNRISLAHWDHQDGTVFVYEISSGELVELLPFFPTITSEGELVVSPFTPTPFVYYNPSLTRLVVVRSQGSGHRNYEMWDVQSQTSIWNKAGIFGSDDRPVWSPDGSSFVVGLVPDNSENDDPDHCEELFLINTIGEQKLLDSCIWGSSSWSNDGVSLVTWKPSDDNPCHSDEFPTNLLMTNIISGEKGIYTICSGESENGISMRQFPIWSPDDRYIAFNLFDVNFTAVEAVILDLAEERATILPEVSEVLGWLHSDY